MATTSITFRTSKETEDRLDELAKATDRSRSWHVEKAVEAYLDLQAWQVQEIMKGLDDARAGRVIEHEKVRAWLESWGTDDETDPPL